MGFMSGFKSWLLLLALSPLPMAAQQGIPDAPKPKNPQGQFPSDAPPAPKNEHPELPSPSTVPDPEQAPPTERQSGGIGTSRNDLYTYSVRVNFVQVPVTVKDSSGRLVPGLQPQDFTVYEDGVPQKLTF